MATIAYMVTTGQYEDYLVKTIALTREAAQRYADHFNRQPGRVPDIVAEIAEIECLPADWAPPA